MSSVGVFTKRVEVELLEAKAAVAVHSLKDLPTVGDPALVLAAIPLLEDRADCVIFNKQYK